MDDFSVIVVNPFFPICQGEVPLVGNVAPDFEAEAVFDQEFTQVIFLVFQFSKIFAR